MLEHIQHTTNNAEGRASIRHKQAFWVLVAVTFAGLLYLSTFQIHINGSGSPYATDVGEIQNALPRWGLIHHSSYPQYSVIGSLFVTLLRPLGIAPAAGASLFSVIWGMVTVGLLVVLAMDLDVPGPFAVLGALAAAVSTSIWIDASLAEVHTMMRFVKPTDDGQITTVIVPWGADYWAQTYAQKFRDLLPNLNLVDHNANPREIVARGDYLLVPDETFIIFPLAYYEERLGPLYLAAAAPGVTEISPEPIVTVGNMSADPTLREVDFDLSNGVKIRAVKTDWVDTDKILLTVYWQTQGTADNDYHVGVHLVAEDPPLDEMDILGQDDRVAPVNNWYPVSLWRPEEIVRDRYLVAVPKGSSPASIRIGMYRSDPEAGFVNTPWLSIPFPSLEQGQYP